MTAVSQTWQQPQPETDQHQAWPALVFPKIFDIGMNKYRETELAPKNRLTPILVYV